MKITEVFSELPSEALIAALKRTGAAYALLLATYSESERRAAAWLEIAPKYQSLDFVYLLSSDFDPTHCELFFPGKKLKVIRERYGELVGE